MRRILTALAVLPFAAAPVLAQDTMTDESQHIRSSEITDGPIYSMAETYDEAEWGEPYGAIDTDWEEIGEIEDLVLDESGEMVGIIAEVGGFLDIADKHVMIETQDLRPAANEGDWAFVTRRSLEELRDMEGVDDGFWD